MVPAVHPLTTSAPYPDAISLTDLRSISGDSIHSSASTTQATVPTPSPTAQSTPANMQAVAGQTGYRKTWIRVRKTLGSWCTASGPPQLLVGLVGLGLAIPLLKFSIYSYQLSQRTAWKDFRQDCKSLNVSVPVNYAVRLAALALWRTQGCLLYIRGLLPLPLFFRFVVLVT
jgi:hypothetical protein